MVKGLNSRIQPIRSKTGFIEKNDKVFQGFSVLINLLLVFRFLQLWINPTEVNAAEVYSMAVLVGFEFIMVHSGVFMAILPKKLSLYLLVPVYGLFALGFNFAVEDNRVLLTYLVVVINRMRFAFSDVSPALKRRAIAYSVFAVFFYFILIISVSVGSDSIPEFGLDYAFTHSHGYESIKLAGGLLTDEPKTAMAFGVAYYFLLAIVEVVLLRRPVKF